MKTVLHVVVGAGIPIYMENSVQSVMAMTSDDVLGIYNFLNQKDRREVEKVASRFSDSRFSLWFQRNEVEPGVKTGSLYRANNSAVEFASGKYEFIHFIQADMQMVHWGPDVVNYIKELFHRDPGISQSKTICVGTHFHSRGRWTAEYATENLAADERLRSSFIHRGVSMSAVGVYDMTQILSNKILFEGSEDEMQDRLGKMGFEMRFLPFPIMSFVPWPATVRNGKVEAKGRLRKYESLPLLKAISNYPPSQLLQRGLPQIFWMEDWVRPNGWDSLWPYWLSDTLSSKWLERRRVACKELDVDFHTRSSARDIPTRPALGRNLRVPGLFELYRSLAIWGARRVMLAVLSSIRYRMRKHARATREPD